MLIYGRDQCNIVKQLSFSIKKKKEKFPRNKSLVPGSYIGNFYNEFREKLTTILKMRQKKTAEEGKLSNSFHEAIITLPSKSDKDTTKRRENYRSTSLMNIDAKILNEILAY